MAALHSGRLDGAVLPTGAALGARLLGLSHRRHRAGLLVGLRGSAGAAGGSGIPVENASSCPGCSAPPCCIALVVCEKHVLGHAVLLLSIFYLFAGPLRYLRGALGVLTSVHAFAVDPSCGLTLLLLLGLLLTCALTLFACGGRTFALPAPRFGLLSKGLLGAAILLLCVACASVLLGTFYPMVFQSLHLGSLSVGAPISIPSSCRWPSA